MVEHRPWLTFITHTILILGCLFIAFPIYTTFVASSHSLEDITSYFPLLPGRLLIENYNQALSIGSGEVVVTVWTMLMNSAIMAFGIAFGQNFYIPAIRFCHRLFPLPLPDAIFLADFHYLDAAGGGPDTADL